VVFLAGVLVTLVGAALAVIGIGAGVPVVLVGAVLLLGGAVRIGVVEGRRVREAIARLERRL
jgi:hypothetical protein